MRAGIKAKADQIAALTGQVTTLTRMNEIEVERGDFYKSAAEKGLKLDSNSGVIVATLQDSNRVCLAQNASLEKENSGLRSSRNTRMLIGFGLGAGLGYGAHR